MTPCWKGQRLGVDLLSYDRESAAGGCFDVPELLPVAVCLDTLVILTDVVGSEDDLRIVTGDGLVDAAFCEMKNS